MKSLPCPDNRAPLSTKTDRIQGNAGHYALRAALSCRKGVSVYDRIALGIPLRIFVTIYFYKLFQVSVWPQRQWRSEFSFLSP